VADAKLARYVFGSVAKHLHDAADAINLPLVVEFLDDRSDAWKNAPSKAEATINGPATREISSGLFRVWVTVVVILSTDKQTETNAYNHLDRAGALQKALSECITVKAYEPGVDDPETLGFLLPRTAPNDSVPIENVKPGEADHFSHSVITARLMGYFLSE